MWLLNVVIFIRVGNRGHYENLRVKIMTFTIKYLIAEPALQKPPRRYLTATKHFIKELDHEGMNLFFLYGKANRRLPSQIEIPN